MPSARGPISKAKPRIINTDKPTLPRGPSFSVLGQGPRTQQGRWWIPKETQHALAGGRGHEIDARVNLGDADNIC